MNKENLIVGFVRNPHGVTGEFKVESASGYYDHIAELKEVTLRNGSISKKCKIEFTKNGTAAFYMKLAEFNSPEEIRKYKGWGLEVQRKYAQPLEKDEWYIEDIKGCSVIWNAGTAENSAPAEKVGIITDVLEGGGGYLLKISLSESCTVIADNIKYSSSGKLKNVLIPFAYKYVDNIDVKNKTVQLMHLWILE